MARLAAMARLQIFEVDQPGQQARKAQRLIDWLHLVPVDFETGASWWDEIAAVGFDPRQPAFVVSIGVTMYPSGDATAAMLRQMAQLAHGSTLALTFLLPAELLLPEDRAALEASQKGAQASGTPFLSFDTPADRLALAREAGFKDAQHVSGLSLGDRYFANRPDGLRPSSGEYLLLAIT